MKIKSLIVGVIAGAALGLFFTQQSGEELRKEIKKSRREGNTGINIFGRAIIALGKNIRKEIRKWHKEA